MGAGASGGGGGASRPDQRPGERRAREHHDGAHRQADRQRADERLPDRRGDLARGVSGHDSGAESLCERVARRRRRARQQGVELVAPDGRDERPDRGDAERPADHADIVSTPEATPAFSRATEFIAAVLIGDMTQPIPSPRTTKDPTRKP